MNILGQQPVTLTRRAAGTRGSDGRFVPGAAAATTIQASVQPTPGKDLDRLPEGERSRDSRTAFTTSTLATADQAAGTPADTITVDGATFEVYQVQAWPSSGPLPHYKVLLLELAESGGAP